MRCLVVTAIVAMGVIALALQGLAQHSQAVIEQTLKPGLTAESDAH
jgi:hypothetical protein